MSTTSCPHCGAANSPDGAFCESCGKALPTLTTGGPRVVPTAGYAASAAGRAIQSEELKAQAKKAAGALLAVAILQAVMGTLLVTVAGRRKDMAGLDLTLVYFTVYGVGVVFFALYLWARKNPFPAAIAGLVVYVTVHLLDAVADPSALTRGILVKVIVIVILVRAIQAGAKHRTLIRLEGLR